MATKITFWYHPESESFWIHNPETDKPLDQDIGDGMSVELSEQEWIRKHIEQIDADPRHTLPEGISAILKGAVRWPGDSISGMIYYDIHKRFTDGYPINTAKVVSTEPGGIFCTQNHKYIVELIQPNKEPAIG